MKIKMCVCIWCLIGYPICLFLLFGGFCALFLSNFFDALSLFSVVMIACYGREKEYIL